MWRDAYFERMRILRRLRFRRRVRFFFHLARILAAALCCGVEERGRGRSTFAGFQRNAGEKRNCLPHAGVFGSVGHRPAWLRHPESRQFRPRAFGTSTSRTARGALHRVFSAGRPRAFLASERPARVVDATRLRGSSPRASVSRVSRRRARGGPRLLRRLLRAAPSVGFTTFRRLFSARPLRPSSPFVVRAMGFPLGDVLTSDALVEEFRCKICHNLVEYAQCSHASCGHVFCEDAPSDWIARSARP